MMLTLAAMTAYFYTVRVRGWGLGGGVVGLGALLCTPCTTEHHKGDQPAASSAALA